MAFDPQHHHRRSIRLRGHDYRSSGAYFVTICVKNHQCVFGDVIGGETQLNDLGCIAQDRWQVIPRHHPGVELDEFVIMPNHMHGIIVIGDSRALNVDVAVDTGLDTGLDTIDRVPTGVETFGKPVAGSLSTIIRTYKAAVTRRSRRAGILFEWQSRFYETVIRDASAFENIKQYILDNPAKWNADRFNEKL